MIEWSIIAWHVTTHYVAFSSRCHTRIATCMHLLHLALTVEKEIRTRGLCNIAVPPGHIVRAVLTRM